MRFGEELRSERERRGISMERLCADTKVNQRFIEALEKDDYKELPGGVFRRGFVRAYLGSVGLEESTWLVRFDASYAAYAQAVGVSVEQADDAWVTFAANVKRNRGTSQQTTLRRWLGVLALLLVLLGAGWAVWHYMLAPRTHRDSHVGETEVRGSFDLVAGVTVSDLAHKRVR